MRIQITITIPIMNNSKPSTPKSTPEIQAAILGLVSPFHAAWQI